MLDPYPTHPYYYKFMNFGGMAPYGSGKIAPAGEWMPTIKKLVPRSSGYHVITNDALVNWIGDELYRVEVRGRWVWKEEGKILVVESYRQHSRVEFWNSRTKMLLACEFAQWALDLVWAGKADPRLQNAIDATRLFVNHEITLSDLKLALDEASYFRVLGGARYSDAEYTAARSALSCCQGAYLDATDGYPVDRPGKGCAAVAAHSAADNAASTHLHYILNGGWRASGADLVSPLNDIFLCFMKRQEWEWSR